MRMPARSSRSCIATSDFASGMRKPEVVERPAAASRRRLQRQHQRRVVRLELGVVGPQLGRLDAEQGADRTPTDWSRSDTFSERWKRIGVAHGRPQSSGGSRIGYSKYSSFLPCSAYFFRSQRVELA